VKHAPVLLLIFRFCIAPVSNAQTLDIEKEIWQLEKTQSAAIVQHDMVTLFKQIWMKRKGEWKLVAGYANVIKSWIPN
jgi:hypothetical protein